MQRERANKDRLIVQCLKKNGQFLFDAQENHVTVFFDFNSLVRSCLMIQSLYSNTAKSEIDADDIMKSVQRHGVITKSDGELYFSFSSDLKLFNFILSLERKMGFVTPNAKKMERFVNFMYHKVQCHHREQLHLTSKKAA